MTGHTKVTLVTLDETEFDNDCESSASSTHYDEEEEPQSLLLVDADDDIVPKAPASLASASAISGGENYSYTEAELLAALDPSSVEEGVSRTISSGYRPRHYKPDSRITIRCLWCSICVTAIVFSAFLLGALVGMLISCPTQPIIITKPPTQAKQPSPAPTPNTRTYNTANPSPIPSQSPNSPSLASNKFNFTNSSSADTVTASRLAINFTWQPATHFNSNSPQAQALAWMEEYQSTVSQMPRWRQKQLMALVTLYHSTTPTLTNNRTNVQHHQRDWINEQRHECYWLPNSNCNLQGSYQELSLSGHGLQGTIPPETFLLTALTTLDLSRNLLTGPLPTEISHLTALTELNLQENQLLSGPIPTQLAQLTALTTLSIQQNNFTATLPTELGLLTALEVVSLERNNLSGNLPSEMGQWIHATGLWLSDNQLSGTVPNAWSQLSNLVFLELQNTSLTGTLPVGLCDSLLQARIDCSLMVCDPRCPCVCS